MVPPFAVRLNCLPLLALAIGGCTIHPTEPTAEERAARHAELRDDELRHFRNQVANGQTRFDLIRTTADDRWMAELKGKPIVSLNIVNRPITDAGLASLAHNPAMKELLLKGTSITDAGMVHLASMPALENVSLSADITDAGLAPLAPLKNLKVLNVSDRITDGGLVHLVGLTNLESVGPLSAVTGKGIDTLAPLKKLSGINLFNSSITDADLDKLEQFPELTHLTLSGTKITDAGLLKLAKLPKLQVLYLSNVAGVTDQGVQKLIEAKPALEGNIIR